MKMIFTVMMMIMRADRELYKLCDYCDENKKVTVQYNIQL